MPVFSCRCFAVEPKVCGQILRDASGHEPQCAAVQQNLQKPLSRVRLISKQSTQAFWQLLAVWHSILAQVAINKAHFPPRLWAPIEFSFGLEHQQSSYFGLVHQQNSYFGLEHLQKPILLGLERNKVDHCASCEGKKEKELCFAFLA